MDFVTVLREFGLDIVVIFALALVVIYQNRRINELVDRLFSVQEARRLEGLETQKQLNQTLQSFSQSTEQLVDKIQIVRGEK